MFDPGFQLSFAAVVAIFVAVPRVERLLEGYPIPRAVATVLAVSTACGVATAPLLWLEFGSVPILSVPANALAEPVVAPILGLGLTAAGIGVLLPGGALALAWINGWLVRTSRVRGEPGRRRRTALMQPFRLGLAVVIGRSRSLRRISHDPACAVHERV